MHNIDEVLADLERLEHKRELAVQAQLERDRQPGLNRKLLGLLGAVLLGSALLWLFMLWRAM